MIVPDGGTSYLVQFPRALGHPIKICAVLFSQNGVHPPRVQVSTTARRFRERSSSRRRRTRVSGTSQAFCLPGTTVPFALKAPSVVIVSSGSGALFIAEVVVVVDVIWVERVRVMSPVEPVERIVVGGHKRLIRCFEGFVSGGVGTFVEDLQDGHMGPKRRLSCMRQSRIDIPV